jgi:hypothetical protein
MKHLAKIQKEFAKQAANWDELSFEVQRDYLRQHPGSRRRLTAKPTNYGAFSAGDVQNVVHEMRNMTPKRLKEIFADSGLLDMDAEEVTLKDIKFGNGKVEAAYDTIWFNENEGRLERTTNFVSWDGKKYTADVSGVSEPIEDKDKDTDGGYVESITAHPEWSFDVKKLKKAWEAWKTGPMTEKNMISPAEKDLREYLQAQINLIFE